MCLQSCCLAKRGSNPLQYVCKAYVIRETVYGLEQLRSVQGRGTIYPLLHSVQTGSGAPSASTRMRHCPAELKGRLPGQEMFPPDTVGENKEDVQVRANKFGDVGLSRNAITWSVM
jgi:hypothetical protein